MPGVVQVKIDVTDPASVAAAAQQCGDTTVLIDNAGIGRTVAEITLAGLEAGKEEVLADQFTRSVKRSLSEEQSVYLNRPETDRTRGAAGNVPAGVAALRLER